MASLLHDEVQHRYAVDPARVFRTLADLDGVSSMGQPVERALATVYFDTAGFDLARHGATLVRRTGGDDDGWHLRVSRRQDSPSEWRLPLGRATRTVPRQLLAPVRSHVRDRRLAPVVRV